MHCRWHASWSLCAIVTGAGLGRARRLRVQRGRPSRGFVEVWSRTLPDAGAPVALSSPNIATLDGIPAVVVGDRAGHLYAFSLATGKAIPGLAGQHGRDPDRLHALGSAAR